MNHDLEYFYSTDEPEQESIGSLNHAIVQGNLTFLLKKLGHYTVCPELSLDVTELDLMRFDLGNIRELRPDISVYPHRTLNRPNDILRMTEMPLLVIEILLPKQGTYSLLEKFQAYFALGIQSCWLVEPVMESVSVYENMDTRSVFIADKDAELDDKVLNIQIGVKSIFE